MERIALVDFCDTLAGFQTIEPYMKYVLINERPTIGKIVAFRGTKKLCNFTERVLRRMRIGRPLTYKDLLVRMMKGISRDSMVEYGRGYYESQVRPKLIPETVSLLQRLQKQGYRIIIVSGGLELYIRYFAEEFHIHDVVSAQLCFSGEICTGCLSKVCMGAEKPILVRQYVKDKGIEGAFSVGISDSASDMPLLNLCEKKIVVSKNAHQNWVTEEMEEIIWNSEKKTRKILRKIRRIISGIINKSVFLFGMRELLYQRLPAYVFGKRWSIRRIKKQYRKYTGKELDLEHPKTLTEKLQWIKLNVHDPFQTVCSDKLAAREVWRQYGEDGLIPLLYQTYDCRDITLETLPDEPCIVKCNNGCGFWQIIRDKHEVDIKELQKNCRKWMTVDFYYHTMEWQYKGIKNCILVEKLLLDKNGRLPNDYKLNYINGELQFIYCSIDREGKNYRNVYSPDWKRMDMEWVAKDHHKGGLTGDDIPCPLSFKRMKEIGDDIAKRFKYVRVDFYDVDGKLYYGEITVCHGAGYNTFEPEYWDRYFGDKLVLD